MFGQGYRPRATTPPPAKSEPTAEPTATAQPKPAAKLSGLTPEELERNEKLDAEQGR